jgi:TrmH family RNA methyltransferase
MTHRRVRAQMGRPVSRRWKEIRSLARRKYRERLGETLVEGRRAVEAAIEAGVEVRDVLVTPAAREEQRLAERLEALGDLVHVVSASDLAEITSVESSQGVLAVVAVERLPREALALCTRLLVFDRLSDPGNAGTLLRTAAWFGVDAVVTSRGTVDLYNPKVVRAAMGGLWDVGHAEVEDLPATLRELTKRGFAVYGADLGGTDVARWRPDAPSVLVLGSEAHGLSEDVQQEIRERVVVPGNSSRRGTESLNVAVAAGILMYAWVQTPTGHGPRSASH